MEQDKEKLIDEILKSAKNARPAEANPYLATRVEAKIQRLEEEKTKNKMPLRWVYAAATVLVLVLIVNITIWRNAVNTQKNSAVQKLMQEYGFTSHDMFSNYSN